MSAMYLTMLSSQIQGIRNHFTGMKFLHFSVQRIDALQHQGTELSTQQNISLFPLSSIEER